MYHVFDAQVNVLINYEQSLKTTLAFVAKFGCSRIILSIQFFYLPYYSRSKLVLGQPNNYFLTAHSTKHFQVEQQQTYKFSRVFIQQKKALVKCHSHISLVFKDLHEEVKNDIINSITLQLTVRVNTTSVTSVNSFISSIIEVFEL